MESKTHAIESIDEEIKACVRDACKRFPTETPEMEKTIEKALSAFVKEGIPLYKSLDIPEDLMEHYYTIAYNLYNVGNFKDALILLRNIYPKDGMNPRYAYGIAACYHQLQDVENAYLFYLITLYLDQEDPLPCYHLYDCCMKNGDHEMAKFALRQVIQRAKENSDYVKLVEAAKINLKSLENNNKS